MCVTNGGCPTKSDIDFLYVVTVLMHYRGDLLALNNMF